MNFTEDHWIAMLPIILVTLTSVVTMLISAFYRNHQLVAGVTVVGLFAALYALTLRQGMDGIQVTPLLVIDAYSLFFSAIVLVTAAAVAVLCHGYFKLREGLHEEIYVLLLIATLGAIVLISSDHFAGFFLGLELLSVSLFAMVAYPVTALTRQGEPIEAGIKYLILSGVSSAFLVFGMALMYAASGTMAFPDLALALQTMESNFYVISGTALIISGICFKLSLVPFHMWTPDIYQGAPAPVTSFVATVSKGAVLAALLKVFIILDVYQYQSLVQVLGYIAIASMIGGNLLALMQSNVKRILAYSSSAHIGYALVAFLAAKNSSAEGGGTNLLAVEAVSYYIVAYVVTSLGALGIVSVLSSDQNHIDNNRDFDRLEDFDGLFWKHPYIASVFIACLLSLAGIPLTIGFIGKFYLFATGVDSNQWTLIAALVIGSSIGLFYYLRLVLTMFNQHGNEDSYIGGAAEAELSSGGDLTLPAGGQVVVALLAVIIVWLGVYPAPLIAAIQVFAKGFG